VATKGTDKAFANIDTEVTSSDFGVVGNMPGVQEDNNFITTYVLWEEIVETSSAQSRGVTYDPEQHPKDAELHDSIKKHGVKTPIIVFRLDDGGIFAGQGERRFRLQAGHRRMEAAKDAGVKGALAVVNTSDDDGDLNTLIENVGRRDLTDYEMAHALRSIMQARGLSEIQEVIEITGLPRDSVYPPLRAYQSPNILRNRWIAGAISTRAVIELRPVWEQIGAAVDNLDEILEEITVSEASTWRAMIEAGAGPVEALSTAQIKKALSTPQHPQSRIAPGDNDRSVSSPAKKRQTKGKRTKGSKKGAAPSSPKQNIAETISVILNIPQDVVEELYQAAIESGVEDAWVIWAACLFVASGGKKGTALDVAGSIMSVGKTGQNIRKYISMLQKLAGERERIQNQLILEYIDTVFPLSKTAKSEARE